MVQCICLPLAIYLWLLYIPLSLHSYWKSSNILLHLRFWYQKPFLMRFAQSFPECVCLYILLHFWDIYTGCVWLRPVTFSVLLEIKYFVISCLLCWIRLNKLVSFKLCTWSSRTRFIPFPSSPEVYLEVDVCFVKCCFLKFCCLSPVIFYLTLATNFFLM